MSEKKKADFYISTVDKKDKTKKQYLMNAWPGNFPGAYGVTINQEVTEEQWLAVYREARKGKEGTLWINLNATKKDGPKKETVDADAPF